MGITISRRAYDFRLPLLCRFKHHWDKIPYLVTHSSGSTTAHYICTRKCAYTKTEDL
jgi:hypothetical protein